MGLTIIDRAIRMLACRADKAETRPLHWIRGDDESESWCYDCARAVARHRRRHEGQKGATVDGGWGSEEDGPRFCGGCQAILECSLTDYGVEMELDAYETDRRLYLSKAGECFLILEALSSGQSGKHDARVRRLARRVLDWFKKHKRVA